MVVSTVVSTDEVDVTIWQHLSGTTWADIGSIDAWESLQRETRPLQAGPWSLSVPLDAETVRFAAANAKKYLVTVAARGEETTGVIEHVAPTQPDTGGISLEISGLDAKVLLGDALIWPKPDVALSAQDVAYYQATGPVATVLRNVTSANMGRLYQGGVYEMNVPVPTITGNPISVRQRFGNLLALIAGKGVAQGIGVSVYLKRQGATSTRANLTCEFNQGRDMSKRAFLSAELKTLRTWTQSDDAPTATRAVTGGGGTGTQRTFVPTVRDDAESEWGRRREVFVAQKDTTDTGELQDAANEELDGAVAQSSFTLEAYDAVGMRYGDHFTLNDLVTIDPGNDIAPRVDRLNAVILTSDRDGVRFQLIPGNPDVTPLYKQAAVVSGLRRKVRDLELEE